MNDRIATTVTLPSDVRRDIRQVSKDTQIPQSRLIENAWRHFRECELAPKLPEVE